MYLITMTYAQLSFLKGWVWLRGLNALSNACIAALNYNVLHDMCRNLGATDSPRPHRKDQL